MYWSLNFLGKWGKIVLPLSLFGSLDLFTSMKSSLRCLFQRRQFQLIQPLLSATSFPILVKGNDHLGIVSSVFLFSIDNWNWVRREVADSCKNNSCVSGRFHFLGLHLCKGLCGVAIVKYVQECMLNQYTECPIKEGATLVVLLRNE